MSLESSVKEKHCAASTLARQNEARSCKNLRLATWPLV